MAKVVSKSGLAAKLGMAGKKAVQEHREDETRMGFVDLPGGIRSGIAKLIDCRFSQYKTGDHEGEYFFLGAGAVLSPKDHDGIPIKGLRTQIMIPMYAEKIRNGKRAGEEITIEERIDAVLNELRKLGYDTSGLEVTDLEAACEELKEIEPTFRFSTRSSKSKPTKANPNPKEFINHNWAGAVDFDADVTTSEVTDDSEEVEEEATEEVEDDTTGEDADSIDLEVLGEAADADDEEAQATLTTLAEGAEIDPNDYELWAELAAVLSEAGTEEVEEEEVAEEPEPAVGECWKYTPTKANPKKLSYDLEITAVIKSKKMVNGKNLDKKNEVVRNVPWSELSST